MNAGVGRGGALVLGGIGLVRRLGGKQGSVGAAIRRNGCEIAGVAGAVTSGAGQLTGEAIGIAGRGAGAVVTVAGMAASEALGMVADGATVVVELAVGRSRRALSPARSKPSVTAGRQGDGAGTSELDMAVASVSDELLVNEVLADEGVAGTTLRDEAVAGMGQPGEALAAEALAAEALTAEELTAEALAAPAGPEAGDPEALPGFLPPGPAVDDSGAGPGSPAE